MQCHYCKKFGHIKAHCWLRDRSANKNVTLVAEENEVSNLFVTQQESSKACNTVWLIDSDCSNHMSGVRTLFKDLDESKRIKVRLGDDKEIQVEGKGNVVFKTKEGSARLLHNVQYVPGLAHNLLSVGQLLLAGYSVTFAGDSCTISDSKTGVKLVSILKTGSNMFPLNASLVGSINIAVNTQENSSL